MGKDGLKRLISYNLKQLLNERNLSQKTLASSTGITKSTLSDYVRGKSYPSPKNIEKIAAALQVSPAAIDPSLDPETFVVNNQYNEEVKEESVPLFHRTDHGELLQLDAPVFLHQIADDSMNLLFAKGEIVLMEESGVFRDGMYAYIKNNISGLAYIRRVRVAEDRLILEPLSNRNEFREEIYPLWTPDITLLGTVRYLLRPVQELRLI